jgi:hypothetical protein
VAIEATTMPANQQMKANIDSFPTMELSVEVIVGEIGKLLAVQHSPVS